jgi:two-component system, OmpR family, phosphate regulon sensor histidine kinase PhoR
MKNISIDNLPLPAVLVSSTRTLLAANTKAVDIFENLTLGADLSTVIRNPQFLETCENVIKNGREMECDFIKNGRRRRSFKATVSAGLGQEGIFITLYETTIAREAERMRASFVADVSHELRSPLTTLIATIETLKGKAGENKEIRAKFINLMGHETNRMHRIVNDLLSLSATEAQEHILPNNSVNLGVIVKNVIKILCEKSLVKDMIIITEIEDNLPDIRGDYDELYQVVYNLLDNAIKYGDEKTDLTLKGEFFNSLVKISVNNRGDTVEEKHIPRLTERFYRADKSRSREMGGTGLGLAIVKHIVNRHLGSLKIESSDQDGTTVSISFPIKKA